MSLTIPYKKNIQYTRIQLQPHMLNSDIKDYMLTVLRDKVENKCNKFGFVEKVNYIDSYNECIIMPENLSGCPAFEISYHCNIVIPLKDTIIIGTVKKIISELIMINNGPLMIFIPKSNIDNNIWDVSNDLFDKQNKTILKESENVKIYIESVKIIQGNNQISCIGRLLERPTEDELNEFYEVYNNGNKKESNFII